jgi:energy-converting hydrogenase A subunit D
MYPFLDLINLTNVSVGVLLIGAAGIIMLKKPLDKVIMFTLLQGGFIGIIVSAKYLDVAMVAAIFDPISTIIMLIAITKLDEIRKKKNKIQEEGFFA